jgi:hypothetical protein
MSLSTGLSDKAALITGEILEVIDRWYQVESQPEWPRANYFKVRAKDGPDYLLSTTRKPMNGFFAAALSTLRVRIEKTAGRSLVRK